MSYSWWAGLVMGLAVSSWIGAVCVLDVSRSEKAGTEEEESGG